MADTIIKQAPKVSLWEKFKNSMTPGIDPDKATQAIIDSEALGISPSEAYDYQDALKDVSKEDPRLKNLQLSGEERVMKRWESGVSSAKQGVVEWDMIFVTDPETFSALEAVSDKLVVTTPPPLHKGIFEKAVGSTAEMLPIMVQGTQKGTERGIKFGIAGGTAAAIAGQAGPQIATPEEILTVPISFASMFSVGFTSGTMENILKIEAGLAFREIRTLTDSEGNKIDPNIARATAFGVGVVNSLIEVAQIRTLLRTFPGAEKLFQKSLRETVIELLKNKTLKGIATNYLKKYGAFVTTETAQELAQESTNITATELAKKLNNKLQGTDIPQATIDEITERLVNTAKESAMSFAVLGVPGHAVGVAKETGALEKLAEPLKGEAGGFGGEKARGFTNAIGKFSALSDKKIRFPISDKEMEITSLNKHMIKATINETEHAGSSSDLENVIDHDELFMHYRELRGVRVRYVKGKEGAAYSSSRNEIVISIEDRIPTDRQIKKILVHEITHVIQRIEGFAKGGDPAVHGKKYEFLAGEVEARDAQEKIDLELEKLISAQPGSAQDISAEDLIVEMEQGEKVAGAIFPEGEDVKKESEKIIKEKERLAQREAEIEATLLKTEELTAEKEKEMDAELEFIKIREKELEKAEKKIAKVEEKAQRKVAEAEGELEFQRLKAEEALEEERIESEAELQFVKLSEKAKAEAKISKVKTAKEIVKRRRARVRAVRDTLQLTDAQLRKISRKDIRLMSDLEFKQHVDEFYNKAVEFQETAKAKAEVMALVQDRQFKKEDNLRKAMKLPPLEKMTTEQAKQYYDALEPYQQGDLFLSPRKLELVDRTDFKGIKTIREALEKTAEKIGVPIESVIGTTVSEFERFKPDTQLAKVSPVFRYIVEKMVMKDLVAQTEILKAEKEVDVLAKKARASRKKTLSEKAWEFIAPQDRNVFQYIEANKEERRALIKEMTPEEIDYANYINNKMAEHLEYLMSIEALKNTRFEDAYINHLRKGLLETVKDSGIKAGIKNLFAKYEHDEQIANILDTATGDVLPLEKFIPNVLFRQGEIDPTQNVAKAFLQYNANIEKKKMLDSTLTELDIIVHALEPEAKTPRGLKLDKSLDRFFKEYVNTKKGRHTRVFIKQGGKLDITLRALRSFTALKDLGGNIIVGFTARLGEASGNFIQLGHKSFAKGLLRKRTAKGKAIAKKYENFVGKSVWHELGEVSKDGGDKIAGALFGLFHHGMISANKTFLLGSMTDAEFKAGELSAERLAQLKLDMGEYRIVIGSTSVFGATPEAATELQYKRWAVPMMQSTYNNLKVLATKKKFNEKEAWQLYRSMEVVLAMSIAGSYIVDQDDDTFIGRARQKIFRELMSIYGALDATFWANQARVISFISNIMIGLKQLMTLEEYEKSSSKWGYAKGELKGVRKLKKELVPRALTQFEGSKPEETITFKRRQR